LQRKQNNVRNNVRNRIPYNNYTIIKTNMNKAQRIGAMLGELMPATHRSTTTLTSIIIQTTVLTPSIMSE
jgi:hypothetical protein